MVYFDNIHVLLPKTYNLEQNTLEKSFVYQ